MLNGGSEGSDALDTPNSLHDTKLVGSNGITEKHDPTLAHVEYS